MAAIQSTQTLARRQSSAGRSLRSVQFACQNNLTGVPSQGQHWECIKTVKMATVTGSWHSLHLGMMSTFDILPPCPKIIIPQLNSTARLLQPLVMNILHHPPTSFSIYTWLSSLSPLLSVCLFIHLPRPSFLFSLSHQLAIHPSSASSPAPSDPLSHQIQSALFAPLGWIRTLQAAASILISFIYFSLYSLSPLLYPIYLSACQLFLPFVNLFLPSTRLNVSV